MEIGGINWQTGADPELFVGKDNVFKCAHGLIPGSKYDPHKVDKGAVQVDGMALEFNIDPASSKKEFEENMVSVMATLKSMVPDLEFLDAASVNFSEKFIQGLPFEATELGCGMDFNAYSMCDNEPPNPQSLMRTAGGHVHIGGFHSDNEYSEEQFCKSAHMARLMDKYVGMPSLVWDTDDKRRGMYGRGGCFRPKLYGMEYRTLSNAWIFTEKLRSFVYDGTMRAIRDFVEGLDGSEDYAKIINTSDRNSSLFKNNESVRQISSIMGA